MTYYVRAEVMLLLEFVTFTKSDKPAFSSLCFHKQ